MGNSSIKPSSALLPNIEALIQNLDIASITDARKVILDPLLEFVRSNHLVDIATRINFICTHNSRRSHFSQVWAQTMAYYFKIDNVFTYSGGTQTTALFPMVIKTLINQGFYIQKLSHNQNPVYAIKYAENEDAIISFSKKLDDDFNPKSDFAAVLTCDSANEACPFVPGASQRIPITFKDPKAFDDTQQQAEKYAETSLQIATELKYVFSNI